jgi:pentose-5-phosphate-3-epimerase
MHPRDIRHYQLYTNHNGTVGVAISLDGDIQKVFHIEVDGGIHSNTAAIARESGANIMVAGTGVFEAEDAALAIKELRKFPL